MAAVGAVKSVFQYATAKSVPIASLGAAITSSIFLYRNMKKVEEGHIGRLGVALGQGKNLYDYTISQVNNLDNAIINASKTATKVDDVILNSAKKVTTSLGNAAKADKLVGGVGKAANWASKNIRPLIIASAGIDIALADDKKAATVENACALSAMFSAEKLVSSGVIQKKVKEVASSKVVQESGFVKKVLPKIKGKVGQLAKNSKFLSKVLKHAPGVVGAVLSSAGMVIASCKAYDAGLAVADKIILRKDDERQEYMV